MTARDQEARSAEGTTGKRERLPDRRACEALRFVVGGVTYHGFTGRAFDPATGALGPVREVFLTAGKTGSAVDITARDAAICASIALQSGVPIDVLRGAVSRHENGHPEGPLGIIFDEISRGAERSDREARAKGEDR